MSIALIGIIKMVLFVVVVAVAIIGAIQTSKGQSIFTGILKFLGVAISTIPIIGLIQWLVFKKSSPSYSSACGTQAIVGLLYYAITQVVLKNGA
jgi:hypothetical protein